MRLLPLLATLGAMAALAPAAAAQAPTGTKMACTNGPNFQLSASPGRVSLPDGGDMFMWSYGNRAAGDAFQLPGPVLCVTQGQVVTVSLLNNLPEATSLSFPGQSGVTSAGGTPGLLGPQVAPGGTMTYSFTASQPGTYLYESATNPHKQVEMGLYGALVVRPTRGADYAYDDAATRFDPDREYLMLMHDLDPELHLAVERGQAYDVTKKHDDYWTINGRSFPDTIADNGASWLPQQPYSSLIRTRPFNATSNPLPALIRYVNAGFVGHPFHPHGNHMRLLAQDGRLLRGSGGVDTTMESFTRTVAPGSTYDLAFRWINADQFNASSNPVPVPVPSNRNLTFKDNATNYSGSPYLGSKGALPQGVQSYNQCGEYYFPLHSHALNEFQNFDEGFGGLATLARVDPPAGCPS
jgi:FtsP/CotA-like multicopper oxidase with cupredoxin domain